MKGSYYGQNWYFSGRWSRHHLQPSFNIYLLCLYPPKIKQHSFLKKINCYFQALSSLKSPRPGKSKITSYGMVSDMEWDLKVPLFLATEIKKWQLITLIIILWGEAYGSINNFLAFFSFSYQALHPYQRKQTAAILSSSMEMKIKEDFSFSKGI